MKRIIYTEQRVNIVRLVFIVILAITFAFPIYACTIFVLTNSHRVLFGNNEDWINPKTRIWFVPAGDSYYGCVYVGYDDGWARGGMNTEGLACDWVGGFNENWQADAATCVRGNPTERMLESCATVEDAIAFFQKHKESDFMHAKIFVADRNGMSVIIGVRDGKLRFERSEQSRGFGYAFKMLRECLIKEPEPTVTNCASILRDCLQEGKYDTKYSNVFDLKSGDIYLYQFHQHVDSIRMNLVVELAKGGHYFDMVQIHRQFSMPLMHLLMNMNRLVIDDFPPVSDTEPKVTNHIRAVMEDAISGKMRAEDYHADLWSSISPIQKDIQNDLKRFGNFQSITLVECKTEKGIRTNRYRIEFDNIRALMRFELDDQDKIISFKSEATERKPGADLGE